MQLFNALTKLLLEPFQHAHPFLVVLLLLLEFEMKEHMNDILATFPTIPQHLELTIE
jgi:hypothetical protein